MTEQLPHTTTVCAWLNTVVLSCPDASGSKPESTATAMGAAARGGKRVAARGTRQPTTWKRESQYGTRHGSSGKHVATGVARDEAERSLPHHSGGPAPRRCWAVAARNSLFPWRDQPWRSGRDTRLAPPPASWGPSRCLRGACGVHPAQQRRIWHPVLVVRGAWRCPSAGSLTAVAWTTPCDARLECRRGAVGGGATHMLKHPGQRTSMKYELGLWTSLLSLCERASSAAVGCRRSLGMVFGGVVGGYGDNLCAPGVVSSRPPHSAAKPLQYSGLSYGYIRYYGGANVGCFCNFSPPQRAKAVHRVSSTVVSAMLVGAELSSMVSIW